MILNFFHLLSKCFNGNLTMIKGRLFLTFETSAISRKEDYESMMIKIVHKKTSELSI